MHTTYGDVLLAKGGLEDTFPVTKVIAHWHDNMSRQYQVKNNCYNSGKSACDMTINPSKLEKL